MLRQNLPTVLILLMTAATLSGCIYSREIAHTRRDIEQHTGADFDRQVVFNLGPRTFRTLSWMAGLGPDDEAQMASAYLSEIRRIKVGVYHTEHLPNLDTVDLSMLGRFERQGWEVAVQTREDDEAVWLLYREQRGEVRDLYVVVLNEEELVLARLHGHLDHLFERAVQDHLELRDWVDDISFE